MGAPTFEEIDDIPEPNDHCGYVRPDDIYVNLSGERIEPGTKIHMVFMGRPNNMPTPWIMVKAINEYSTVNQRNTVNIIVRATNGKEMSFSNAHYYSPHPIEEGENEWEDSE